MWPHRQIDTSSNGLENQTGISTYWSWNRLDTPWGRCSTRCINISKIFVPNHMCNQRWTFPRRYKSWKKERLAHTVMPGGSISPIDSAGSGALKTEAEVMAKLKLIVQFVVGVYWPVWFAIKVKNSWLEGPNHILKQLSLVRRMHQTVAIHTQICLTAKDACRWGAVQR